MKTVVAIAVLTFAIGAGILLVQHERERRTEQATEEASAPPPAPPIDVTAKDLQRAYDANEVAADQQYRGRVLRVTGSVRSIDKDFTDQPIVWLRTRDFGGVMSYFDDASGPASLRKGQKVTVRCVGGGRTIDSPVLRRCVLE